jgi:hypothetical protein
MTETLDFPTVEKLQAIVDQLRTGSYLMFQTLQMIAGLHDVTELEDSDGVVNDACEHCSEINGGIVVFPCPTIQVLMSDFVIEDAAAEEPAAEEA